MIKIARTGDSYKNACDLLAMKGDGNKTRITGNTLRVYVYLLKHGPSELRDIQRDLDLSTPSLASYHLGRLIAAGYVGQDEKGRYLTTKDASTEIMEGYTKIGTNFVPQLFFLALLFTILVGYFSFRSLYLPTYVPLLVASSIAALALLWLETFRLWRRMVSWK